MNNGNNITLLLLEITQELESDAGWSPIEVNMELLNSACPDILLLGERQEITFYQQWAEQLGPKIPNLNSEETAVELAKVHRRALGYTS